MPRVKRGTIHAKKRRSLLSKVKGYQGHRRSKLRAARVAFLKAGVHAYRDRRRKKRDFRRLWQIRINAGARQNGTTYSRLVNALKNANIGLNRKMLAELAANHPESFKKVVETATK